MSATGIDPFDFLQGRTPFCQADGCGRRTLTLELTYCHSCQTQKDRPRYQSDLQKEVNKSANKKWFYEWNFADDPWATEKGIACACCHIRFAPEEYGEYRQGKFIPYIACCPMTDTCHAAKNYWGKGNKEPNLALRQYLKDLRAVDDSKHESAGTQAPKNTAADLSRKLADVALHVGDSADEGEDVDYIDLRKGRRRVSISH